MKTISEYYASYIHNVGPEEDPDGAKHCLLEILYLVGSLKVCCSCFCVLQSTAICNIMWSPNIIHTVGLYIPPVDKYPKDFMFQHAVQGFVMDSWCDRSGTLPLAYWRRTLSQEAVVGCLVPPVFEQCKGHPFRLYLQSSALAQYIHCRQETPYWVFLNPILLTRKVI